MSFSLSRVWVARTMEEVTKKGSSSGGGGGGKSKLTLGKRPMNVREEGDPKRPSEDDMSQRDWAETIAERGFTCERQVCRGTRTHHIAMSRFSSKGLTFFFEPLDGYYKSYVIAFYSTMKIDKEKETITSKVGSKTIVNL